MNVTTTHYDQSFMEQRL